MMAKGSELKFNSLVIGISQGVPDEADTITVSISGADIAIIVVSDTEIGESGEEIGLADVSAGDFVRITAFFPAEGLVAEEIEVLDERSEQFRLRGAITATDTVGDDNGNRRHHGRGHNDSRGHSEDDDDSDRLEVGAETILASDDTELGGKFETNYKEENGEVEQKVEIEIEDAVPGTEYTIVVLFGDQEVEFGTMTANELGQAEAEFKAKDGGDDDDDQALSALLPDGLDVRDITGVKILEGGSVILAGDF